MHNLGVARLSARDYRGNLLLLYQAILSKFSNLLVNIAIFIYSFYPHREFGHVSYKT